MEWVMSYLAGNANLRLDKSIKSQSFPPQPHVGSQGWRQTICICLYRELNEPHYSAFVGKHYEDSNVNYQSLSSAPLNSTQSSKVSSHPLIYPYENNPTKNWSSWTYTKDDSVTVRCIFGNCIGQDSSLTQTSSKVLDIQLFSHNSNWAWTVLK